MPMTTQRGSRNEFQAIRGFLADAALDRALIGLGRLDLALKNWETQPRAPAGQPDGGRWVIGPGGVPLKLPPTSWSSLRDSKPEADQPQQAQTESTTLEDGTRVLSIKIRDRRGQLDEQHAVIAPNGDSRIFENSGETQTIRDGETGEILSRTTFTPSQLISEPIVQPAFFQAVPAVIVGLQAITTIELALSLYAELSRRNSGFGTVLGLTAHEYNRDPQIDGGIAAWVGQLDQEQLDNACPRNAEVRAMPNEVARDIRLRQPNLSALEFGNALHRTLKDRVDSLNDPNFVAELLLSPTGNAPRANEKGNVRLDLFEQILATHTICVYDYKTGDRDLKLAHARRIADYVYKKYRKVLRIIVIQVKPEK